MSPPNPLLTAALLLLFQLQLASHATLAAASSVGAFVNPAQMPSNGELLDEYGSDAVYAVGDSLTVAWNTSYTEYTIALWQEALSGDAATLGEVIFSGASSSAQTLSTVEGTSSSSSSSSDDDDSLAADYQFSWTVQTYDLDAADSAIFFLWLAPSTASSQGNKSLDTFASVYFNVTSDDTTTTTTTTSATTSPTTTDLSLGLGTQSSDSTTTTTPPSQTTANDNINHLHPTSTTLPAHASPSVLSSTSSSSDDDNNNKATLSTGAEVGIAIGVGTGLAGALAAAGAFFWVRRQRQLASNNTNNAERAGEDDGWGDGWGDVVEHNAPQEIGSSMVGGGGVVGGAGGILENLKPPGPVEMEENARPLSELDAGDVGGGGAWLEQGPLGTLGSVVSGRSDAGGSSSGGSGVSGESGSSSGGSSAGLRRKPPSPVEME